MVCRQIQVWLLYFIQPDGATGKEAVRIEKMNV